MLGAEHLVVWDKVTAAPPHGRAVGLAYGFGGASSPHAAATWAIGERDAYLLAVHRAAFGDQLDLLAPCPACSEAAAFEVSIDLLLSQAGRTDWPLRIRHQDSTLICRRPAAADVAAAWAAAGSLEEARRRLCEACLDVHVADGDRLENLDENVIAAVSTAMADADPLADIRFTLTCPACALAWDALFDPPQILWRAFDAWAHTALIDVTQLARAYGWSEHEILAMHPSRRRFYLDAAA
jgi:hypothetical protein